MRKGEPRQVSSQLRRGTTGTIHAMADVRIGNGRRDTRDELLVVPPFGVLTRAVRARGRFSFFGMGRIAELLPSHSSPRSHGVGPSACVGAISSTRKPRTRSASPINERWHRQGTASAHMIAVRRFSPVLGRVVCSKADLAVAQRSHSHSSAAYPHFSERASAFSLLSLAGW